MHRLRPDLTSAVPILYHGRKPQPGEEEGVDYYFHSEDEIRELPADRSLLSRLRTICQA